MAESAGTQPAIISTGDELAMRRTGMSFQRTRLAADRTLMAVIRTSLSLISFGFTIYQFFKKLQDAGVLKGPTPSHHFGVSLVLLGVALLILGIIYHIQFMLGLRAQRHSLKVANLVHAESGFPVSLTLIVAVVLLLIGLLTAGSMIFHFGPFE